MTLHLTQNGDGIHFTGSNDDGYELTIRSSDEQTGISPMEMTALSVGGCSSIDVLLILDKQQQSVDHFEAEVDAQRDEDGTPAVFTDIHVHYRVEGNIEPDKMRRAIELSLDKYCSVSHMIESTADITYSFAVNGERYDA